MWTSRLTSFSRLAILPHIMTIPTTPYLTEEGLVKAKKELDELRTVKRKEIVERIARAKEMGDLSENAEYASAREDQSFTEGRILELESLIRNATVISHAKNSETIELGSVVKVQIDGMTREYTIVGSNEADPLRGKISNASPLGEAFLGKRLGDVVTVQAPKGEMRYTILGIE